MELSSCMHSSDIDPGLTSVDKKRPSIWPSDTPPLNSSSDLQVSGRHGQQFFFFPEVSAGCRGRGRAERKPRVNDRSERRRLQPARALFQGATVHRRQHRTGRRGYEENEREVTAIAETARGCGRSASPREQSPMAGRHPEAAAACDALSAPPYAARRCRQRSNASVRSTGGDLAQFGTT